MKNLLDFLKKYNSLIIFLILEGIAFYFIVTKNFYHNTKVVNRIRWATHGVETKLSDIKNYLNLREINENLANENTMLQNSINRLLINDNFALYSDSDTIFEQIYQYTSARLTSNSVNKRHNFFTINKGVKNGLAAGMAVIADGGVAGVISGCSENFSIVMSLINLDFRLSARIKSSGYFGSLMWDGRDYRTAILHDIPQHITINVGDTIETTGYSAIFPEGVTIGVISDYEKPGSDFYIIKVRLKTDFRKLNYVNIVNNKRKEEFIELENRIND